MIKDKLSSCWTVTFYLIYLFNLIFKRPGNKHGIIHIIRNIEGMTHQMGLAPIESIVICYNLV